MIWVVAASVVTTDGALVLLALLVGFALLDALRGIRLTSPLVPVDGVPVRHRSAAGTVGPRPSRFLLSTFRC